jgi:hypothetical protein
LLFHAECFVGQDIQWPLLVTCKVLVAQFHGICSNGPSWGYWIRALVKSKTMTFSCVACCYSRLGRWLLLLFLNEPTKILKHIFTCFLSLKKQNQRWKIMAK